MFAWIRNLLGRRNPLPPPEPAKRRMKTYQADSGYVYQYVFEGRHCLARETEFIFSVSADRKRYQRSIITIPDASLAPYEQNMGRRLAENERYGVAKIALFRLFDAQDRPEGVAAGALVSTEMAEEYLSVLGI